MKSTDGPVEYALGKRTGKDFPEAWGQPPGSPYSETRANWVRANVQREVARSGGDAGARRRAMVRAQDRRLRALKEVVDDLHERFG